MIYNYCHVSIIIDLMETSYPRSARSRATMKIWSFQARLDTVPAARSTWVDWIAGRWYCDRRRQQGAIIDVDVQTMYTENTSSNNAASSSLRSCFLFFSSLPLSFKALLSIYNSMERMIRGKWFVRRIVKRASLHRELLSYILYITGSSLCLVW